MPQVGTIENVNGILAVSFGTIYGPDGEVAAPGATNLELARYIVNDEMIRDTKMPLAMQQEVVMAARLLDPSIDGQIAQSIDTNKRPGLAFNTREVAQQALKVLVAEQVGTLAVIAFQYHRPRAVPTVQRVVQTEHIEVVSPDMRNIGDFDPNCSQSRPRSRDNWKRGERVIIPFNALMGYI